MSFDNDHPNRKDHRKPTASPRQSIGAVVITGPGVTAVAIESTVPSSGSKPQRPGKRNRIYAGVGVDLIGYSSRNP